MAYREVPVFEVREVLRLWLAGEGLRAIERLVGLDCKTVRRYVAAAEELGLDREAGEAQLSDVFVGQVVEAVRPHRVEGRGEAWRVLAGRHEPLKQWLEIEKLRVVDVPPDDRGRDRRLRGGVAVLRWRVPHGDPRQPQGGRRQP